MKKISLFVSLLILLSCISIDVEKNQDEFGHGIRIVSIEVDPVYKDLLYPRDKGWLGSDAAHSISLSNDRILWLFGDTFIGEIKHGKRVTGADFINNTIGIHDRRELPGSIDYYWQQGEERNLAFFMPQGESAQSGKEDVWIFYWPTMGAMLDDELFIFAYRLESSKDSFDMPTTLIRVPNPLDPPDKWIKKSYDLGLGGANQGFHSAMYVDEPYVYFLGYDDPLKNPYLRRAVLARAKKEDLLSGGLGEVFEFWVESKNGPCWGDKPEKLITLFEPGITESDFQYIPEWDLYLCTAYHTEGGIYLTSAPELTGPWTEPFKIYDVPEHSVSFKIISYAARLHPELSTKTGELIITYETNAYGTTEPLFTEEGLQIYYPRFLRVQLELVEK